jgi:hypothetical protein
MDEKRAKGRPKSATKKVAKSIRLAPDLDAMLENAAYWARTSTTAILEEGAREMVKRLEREHNGGKPFPSRPAS